MDERMNARQLVDRIVYLASLMSEPQRVDTILDKLRVITARSSKLSDQDIKALKPIKNELEDYLVTKERIRSFTKASLRAHVEQHFAARDPVRDVKRGALGQIAVTFGVAAATTAVPALLGLMEGQVILAFFICILFIGLALLFQSIKKDLVAQLHGSVNYLMAATVGTGLFAVNFPVIAGNEYLNSHPMFQYGGFLIGAVPVYAFYYMAFYLYAKQLGVSIPKWLRPSGAVMAAAGVAMISVLLPHPVPVSHEIFFDLAVSGFAVSVYFSAAAAVLGFKVVEKTTAIYSKTALFLAVSMVFQAVGNGFFLVFVTFISGDFPVNEQKGQILTGLLIIIALVFQYIAVYKSKTSLR
jgi:hypothetical protein